MEKCRKGSQKGVLFPAGKLSFFKDFDLGAPGVPKEATKLPKDGQGTPNGRPRVYKCFKRVWTWSPKVAKSWPISLKGTAMTQTSVISTLITQKHTEQEVRTRALRNWTCNAQWRA